MPNENDLLWKQQCVKVLRADDERGVAMAAAGPRISTRGTG